MTFNSPFFRNQLVQTINRVIEEEFPNLMFADGTLIYQSGELNPALPFYEYHRLEKTGMARLIKNNAEDIPKVEVGVQPIIGRLHNYYLGVNWTLDEQEMFEATGNNTLQRRLMAMREGHELTIDKISQTGDPAASEMVGLLNHPNIGETTLPATGTGSSTLWANKTVEQIYTDLTIMGKKARVDTRNTYNSTVILLPLAAFETICQTYYDANKSITIMDAFLTAEARNRFGIKEIVGVPELDSLGYALAYDPSDRYVRAHLPRVYQQLPEFQKSEFLYSIAMRSTFGGVQLDQPLMAQRFLGIL